MQGVPAARLQLQLSALCPVSSQPSGHVQLGVCCDNDSGGLALAVSVSRREILTSFVSQTVTPGTTDLVCELSVICVRIKPDNDDDDDYDNFISI